MFYTLQELIVDFNMEISFYKLSLLDISTKKPKSFHNDIISNKLQIVNKKLEYLKNVHGLNDHWSLVTQGEHQTRKFLRAGEFFKGWFNLMQRCTYKYTIYTNTPFITRLVFYEKMSRQLPYRKYV